MRPRRPAAIDLADLGLQIDDLGNTRDSRGKLTLRTRVGSAGSLELRGALGLNPVIARLRVDAKSIGVLPAQPYFSPYVNLVVGSGSLSTQGDLGVDLPDQGALRAAYRGDVTLADFAAAVKGGGDDLLRWKSLSLGSVDFALTPSEDRRRAGGAGRLLHPPDHRARRPVQSAGPGGRRRGPDLTARSRASSARGIGGRDSRAGCVPARDTRALRPAAARQDRPHHAEQRQHRFHRPVRQAELFGQPDRA
jgi:hypothetical protein